MRILSGILTAGAVATVAWLPSAAATATTHAAHSQPLTSSVAWPDDANFRVTPRFSPNGDGIADVAVVRYSRTTAGRSTLIFSKKNKRTRTTEPVRTVRLGRQDAGRFSYRWDGRDDAGKQVSQGPVWVTLDRGPRPNVGGKTWIDRSFRPDALKPETFGKPRATPRVFPRSRSVRDGLPLSVSMPTDTKAAWLVVTRPDGKRFRDRSVDTSQRWSVVKWEARRKGKPLPAGRYQVALGGVDTTGNRGVGAPVAVRVSNARLGWQRVTRTVAPAPSFRDICWFVPSPGCGDRPVDCGTTARSARYPDGLSYRSRECAEGPDMASAMHYTGVPETAGLRGVHAINVSFTGSPTVEGTADVGTLRIGGGSDGPRTIDVSGSTGATTGWLEAPVWGLGDTNPERRIAPGAVWTFFTEGTNSVDVESFTVSMRYLQILR